MKLDLNSLVVVSQQDNHNIIWEKALSLPLLEDRKLLVSEDQKLWAFKLTRIHHILSKVTNVVVMTDE